MNSNNQFIIGDHINKQQECTINNQQAKQIASIKWLLQKAYDIVPEHLKEPFYYDKRQQQQNISMAGKNCNIYLKPNIVYSLANAELYCLALANIYLDPNFHNLNHTGIIQALARKGVMLSDPQLTETILLQTSPLKLTAHLCVIEAIMILFTKEIATPDRIFAAIKQFSISPVQRLHNDFNSNSVIQQQWNFSDYDQLLLFWISEAVSAFNKRVKQQQLQSQIDDVNVPDQLKNTNEFFKSPGRELTELCDGVALCALISFYSPQSLPWNKIRAGKPINTAECIHNLTLFSNFCQFCLPYQIFHMMPQDLLPHSISGMRTNLLALLADLFNLFEIHPSSTSADNLEKTTFDKIEQDSRTSSSSPKTDRKLKNNNISDTQNNADFFVVHKGKNIPTLSSVNSETNQREKHFEPVAAGKPSNWNDTRKNHITGCGRRSRRNSFSDESQLTIENFGGSHENINLLGRNPDKEPAIHVNSNSDDSTSNSEGGKQFRQAAAQENWSSAAITSLLREDSTEKSSVSKPYNTLDNSSNAVINSRPVSTSTAPSMETAEMIESCKVSSQMLNIRLKLEEKRRQIEMEKRRLELNLKKQRQKLNKAAFLQAVSKIENDQKNNEDYIDNVNNCNVTGDGNGDGDNFDGCKYIDNDIDDVDHDSIIAYEDINQVEQRWLKKDSSKDIIEEPSSKHDGQSIDYENIDIEKCQRSISEMDSSLHAIQTDLQWLSLKENEMLQNPAPVVHNMDVTKSNPASFSVNQESQYRSPLLHNNTMFNNYQSQNNNFCLNQVDHNLDENRIFATVPNKTDFNYTDGYSTFAQHNRHHHSLLSTVSMKSPLPSPHAPVMAAFDNVNSVNDNCCVYQMHQQPQPLYLHTHMSPNFKYNYHSMNLTDNDGRNLKSPNNLVSDDKENQIHQTRHEQFYLHKPCENPPFQIHSSSTSSPIINLSSISSTTFGQRKTWENNENLSNVSPQPTPPPRTFTSRYSQNKDTMSFSKSFTDNKIKTDVEPFKYSEEQCNLALYNDSDTSQGITLLKKNYVSSQDDKNKLNYNSHMNISEIDAAPCHTAMNSLSIPTPSADDMEPQCISFIGCQLNDESNIDNKETKSQFNENANKLNIIDGNRTYRIPSPTNKPHSKTSGHYPFTSNEKSKSEKGFYVPFSLDDDEGEKDNVRFSEKNAVKAPFRLKRFNNGNSISSARNDKLKNSFIKKPELNKKPETVYNEKSELNENQLSQRLQENINNSSADKIIENHSEDTIIIKSKRNGSFANSSVGLVINSDVNSNDPALVDEMERKKERILLQSLQRRQQQEEMKARKEIELQRRKEQEKQKEEVKAKKKEEEKRRRAMILEQHRLKKTVEELEREGKPIDKELLNAVMMNNASKLNAMNGENNSNNIPTAKLRSKKIPFGNRPRPKTIHIDLGSNLKENNTSNLLSSNFSKKGSSVNLSEHNNNNYGINRRDYYRGSQDCLLAGTEVANTAGTSASSIYSDLTDEDRAISATYPINGSTCGSIGRRRGSSYKTSRDVSLDRATSRIARPKFSSYYQSYPRKSSSLMNLCGSSCDQDSFTYNSRYLTDTDSGLGRATPPHRTSSPAPNNSSPSGPGSLPPSHHSRRLRFDDTASESGGSEYSGLRLYKQPTVKSNRGIIMNAIEYCVFPGEVNRNAKNRILEEINRADATNSKHFLVLFRDARCQFRALYSYFPENEEVTKVCGTGPKQVTEKMFDKFFKYNSGGKCFTQVHTKHLTVTIDAFTIHNSLWQGKKVNLPNKRDMTLVI